MTAADPIPEDEIPGAPVYFEPKPLHAVSEHKTLELETVKLAEDIDPRKLPTELKLRRPVLHVLPASDPNWPAPSPQPDAAWPSPQYYDSNWPPPETVLTTSQPPLAARRRTFLPLLMFVLLAASLLLLLGARALRRTPVDAVTAPGARVAQAALPMPAPANPSPKNAEPAPGAAPTAREGVPSASASGSPSSAASVDSAVPVDSAAATDPADSAATAVSASPLASGAVAEPSSAVVPHHPPFKSIPPTIASSSALSAPTTKPKRAIY